MIHQFKVALAKEYGIEEAIIIHNFHHWITENKANERNYYDGRYWTFNTQKAYAELFPYFSEGKVKRIINRLIDMGLLMKGNYNANQYDRTNWYAFTDKGMSIVQNLYIDWSKMANGKAETGRPIPNNKPNNKQYTLTHSDERSEDELFDKAETSTMTMLSCEADAYAEQAKAERDAKFEDLWQMYERKGSKANARKEFAKLSDEEIEAMRCHIPAYLQSRPEKRYRQDFERYIKHKTFCSVVYGNRDEVLYDPEASDANTDFTSTPAQHEFKKQNETVTINGVTYR